MIQQHSEVLRLIFWGYVGRGCLNLKIRSQELLLSSGCVGWKGFKLEASLNAEQRLCHWLNSHYLQALKRHRIKYRFTRIRIQTKALKYNHDKKCFQSALIQFLLPRMLNRIGNVQALDPSIKDNCIISSFSHHWKWFNESIGYENIQ